jgi:glutamyl-tRNA reductase
MDKIYVTGFNFKETDFSILEKVVLKEEEISICVSKIKEYYNDSVLGIIILSTCNRLEVYYSSQLDGNVVAKTIIKILSEIKQINISLLLTNYYLIQGEHCVKHLFLVCSGLDSMIIGENFIVSQIKQAIALCKSTTDTNLNVMFNMALSVSKKIRNLNLSFFDAWGARIANIINQNIEKISNTSILFIGAGSMMPHIIQSCQTKVNKLNSICAICNRTYENAEKIALKFGIKTVSINNLTQEMLNYDIIVSCVSDTENIFGNLFQNIKGKLLIDLSMPPILSEDCKKHNLTFTIREISQIINKESSIKKEVISHKEIAILLNKQVLEFTEWTKRRQEHI